MAKILKRQKGKNEVIEVNTNEREENWNTRHRDLDGQYSYLGDIYKTMFEKVSNSYNAIEQEHGQFEFDKFDCLHEAFAIVQEYLNNGMTFVNLEHYCKKVFLNIQKNYHRKYVKPVNSDTCFVEFNTDKMLMYDENSPDTNYLDQGTIDRRYFVKTIIQNLKKKGDKKLFALYHCKEHTQKELTEKLELTQQAVSIRIKRLNHKIQNVCKKFKIDTLLNTAFAMPSWKHESLAGKWTQKYNTKPSMSQDSHLKSQKNNQGINFEPEIDFYDMENTGIEIPTKEKEIKTIQKGRRNINQDGFFANTVNQTRLMELLDSDKLPYKAGINYMPQDVLPTPEKCLDSTVIKYGSDIFNAFYSEKNIFESKDTD